MTLSSPLFLIGLVAVAIPVIVHLFNFRRYRKVYFSNVDYLEQLQTETRRQSRLRQLLILAAVVFGCTNWEKLKKVHPIVWIALSAGAGILFRL